MDDTSSASRPSDPPVPEAVDPLCEGAVEAGLFESREALVETAVREYFGTHRDERVTAAVTAYENDDLMLGEAAMLAGMDRFSFREALADRGVERRVGPREEEGALADARTAKGRMESEDESRQPTDDDSEGA